MFLCPRSCLRIWSRETDSAIPSRASFVITHTKQAESGAYSRDSSDFRGGVHLFILPYAIGLVPSLTGHAIAYQWRSLTRVHRHRAGISQRNSSYGCYLCVATDHLMCVSFFLHPLRVLVSNGQYVESY